PCSTPGGPVVTAPTPPRGAPWLVRAFHELQRRRHLVLHGNIEDLVRWNDVYQPFPATLNDFLAVAGFDVIVPDNLVGGLTSDDAKRRELVQLSLGPSGPPDVAAEPVPTSRRDQVTSSAELLQQQIMAAGQAEPRTPGDVLTVAYRLLTQQQATCVLVLD